MSTKIDRKEALDSVRANVQNGNVVKHMLATEAILSALAKRLGEDEKEWGLTGLLHNIDIDLVEDDPKSHGRLGADIARELGASEAMTTAILRHNESHGIPQQTRLGKALSYADPLAGLIIAAALVHRNKLKGLTTKSVIEHFQDKSFAPGVKKERLLGCNEIGLGLEDLVDLGLKALKGIASELEL